MSEDLPVPSGDNTPASIYAKPAEWVAAGAGAQGNLFLTGRAGTGKTTLLRKFMAEAGENAIVLAPTGVAAMNAGGQTLHSFFKFPPRLIEPTDVKRLRTARLMKTADTIIIDEISMVRADMLDAIDRSLKLNRANKRPFGGARMILAGDLHQLPPVVRGEEHEILQDRYGGHYFFNAPAFKEAEFALLALKHVFRQADPRFLALLGAMRQGRITPADESVLRSVVSKRNAIEASETHVVLTPNNANAYRINQARLDDLPGKTRTFDATVQGTFDEKSYPTEADLELKTGARVMLIKNDPEGRWVNGSLCTVEGFSGRNVIVELDGKAYEIEPAAWEKYKYAVDPETKKVSREVVGTFKQVPLRLAYAVTIHKAQGLTLEKVFIDFDSGMFAHGQAYVAFSRARSLEGLEISRPLRPRDMVLDRNAFAFGKLEPIENNDAYLLAKFAKAADELV
ncbi:MAG: AAA family ATPase [Henriciella sp.]|jgi:ATP-dependent exoDNAse (exonuclease V) alpha subunit